MIRGSALLVTSFVLLLGSGASSLGYDRRITVTNNTDRTIVGLYAVNVGRKSWASDILDHHIVEPGQAVTLNLDDGTGYCRFNFKTVFEHGTSLVRHGVNVCEVATYRLTGDATTKITGNVT